MFFVDPRQPADTRAEEVVNWLEVYQYAIQNLQPVRGIYHDNYIVTDPDLHPCVVRVPKNRLSPDVEPRMFSESAVLEAAGRAMAPCPRLLYSSAPDPFLEVRKHFRPSSRPFRLCHGDLGRPSIMIDQEGVVSFIDWELAVWGDPLWDIAAHLHRMRYPHIQNKFVRQDLLASCRGFSGLNSQYDELRTFLYIERCRSLVLDAIRDLRAIAAGTMENIAGAAADYAAKLSQASVTTAPAASIEALYLKYGSR